jgi:uncharacterized protein YgiB involved in biofilm formation
MKRSKKAALILMVPATTLLLAGCGEEPEQALVFNNPTECSQSLVVNNDSCVSEYESAKVLHPQVAPKYLTKEECETDFGGGQCETAPQQTTSGGSVFMPMMMGYMMASMLNRGGATVQQSPATGAASKLATQPLYKSRDDRATFRTATNTPVAKGIGPITLRPSQVKPQAGQVVRRGGFGQQAAARNSFGG